MFLREFTSDVKEADIMSAFKDFFPIAMHELKITKLPKIRLTKHVAEHDQPTFGRFSEQDNDILIGIANRHVLDILRTLAHELVHYKQGIEHQLESPHSGDTGSPQENEAHAVAGVIMRHFNKKYPHYFKTKPLEL